MTVWLLPLTFQKPPLTLNQRLHWTHRKRMTEEIQNEIILRCRQMKVPAMDYAAVRLIYFPGDKRRRDVDNLVPTSKAALDGIVRAGLLPDDTPEFVDHKMPAILASERVGVGRMFFEVSDEG